MTAILHAILLGIVEGITEFLPISSTGHLLVTEELIGYKDTAHLFTVVVQIGAAAAIAWHYRIDLWQKIAGFFEGKKNSQKFWINLAVATIPAGAIGLLLDKTAESYATPVVIACALALGGVVMLLAERKFETTKHANKLDLESITLKQAIWVGTAQVAALIPGVSRSGATIIGGMYVGLSRTTAASFSFYLSLPILGLASLYKLVSSASEIKTLQGGVPALLAGVAAAFISALLVISWLLKYLANHNFRPFAYYRIGFGLFLLLLVWFGVL